MKQDHQTIDISTSTILRVIIIIGALVFLYIIRDILLILFLSLIVVSAINPGVSWLQRRKIPRILGVIIIYLVFLFVFATVIYLVVPPLAQEVKNLARDFPGTFTNIEIFQNGYQFTENFPEISANIKIFLTSMSEKLELFGSSFFNATVGVFGSIVSGILILVISFYLAIQEEGIKKFFYSVLPSEHQPYVFHLWSRTETKMGRWLQGQLFLGLIVGLLTFIGLSILGVKYSLMLAVLAAVFELVPYAGPILAAIPAVILGMSGGLALGSWVILVYIIIQRLENDILVPKVMQRAVSLNPIIIIIAILVGAKLAGIMGIIIAVPLAAILAEFFYDFTEHRQWKIPHR
jgi:predicted PurR-regulated permease PerM